MGPSLFIFLFFIFLIVFIIRFLFNRSLLYSLSRVTSAARRLSSGEIFPHLPLEGPPAVQELVRAFNQIGDSLKQQINQLQEKRSQMEGIVQNMAEGVLVVSPREEILLMNPAAQAILDVHVDVKIGRSMGEAVRYPELVDLIHGVLRTGLPQSHQMTFYTPQERFLNVQATTYQNADLGNCALVVLYNITDLKRTEQIRREFVANVSHELKTPLTAIRATAETLLEGISHEAEMNRSFLQSILEETDRLQHLVEDLLTLARVESKEAPLTHDSFLLSDFLREQVARHHSLARTHRVTLHLEEVPHHMIHADKNQLSQALSNLLDNAIKYNRPDGKVHVRATMSGTQVGIEVEDTGIGIPAEDLPRIFERFYRVDKARSRETGGTGLGLSIVKHAAEAHGGSVEVQSEFGQGSCFTIILPS